MTEFFVDSISCSHCITAVTSALHALDPAAEVLVDLGTKRVRIDSEVDRFLLSQTLRAAGYIPQPIGLAASDQHL